MANNRKSFDQVKGILAKLDSSIDSARQRRLSDGDQDAMIGQAEDDGVPRRARPMRRESVFKSPVDQKKSEAWRGPNENG